MKKIFLFAFIGLVAIFSACGPTSQDAADYNDKIVADESALIDLDNKLFNSIKNVESGDSIDKVYNEYLDKLNECQKKYEEMKPFDDSDILRKAMIDFVKSMKSIATVEYKEFIDICTKKPEEMTGENYKRIDELLNAINDKSSAANKTFLDAQSAFAKEMDFDLGIK